MAILKSGPEATVNHTFPVPSPDEKMGGAVAFCYRYYFLY